jgi:hypothetical protein
MEENAIDHAKDRGGARNPDGERDERRESEPGIF